MSDRQSKNRYSFQLVGDETGNAVYHGIIIVMIRWHMLIIQSYCSSYCLTLRCAFPVLKYM